MNIKDKIRIMCHLFLSVITFGFVYFFPCLGFSQERNDLARYTPEWIKNGFADAGATHEPWIFQTRRILTDP